MANDQLIAAIRVSPYELDEIADIAGVDPRTAQRWLAGRVPHPRYRAKIAAALETEERELWPETGRVRAKAWMAEIVSAVPRRSDPDASDWRALLRAAERQIDLLGYSLEQIAGARQINKTLIARAHDGCQIRIALADPSGDAARAADQQQRPAGRLIRRIQASHHQLAGLIGQPGIELRQHQIATTHTVLRFDEQMLLTIHLQGTPGFQAPMLQLRRERDYGLFDQLATHFDDVWQTAQPIAGQAPARNPTAAPPDRERDDFLDRLDDVWRPGR